MNNFSWGCKICGQDIASFESKESPDWMSDTVAVCADGFRVEGSYDGHGALNTVIGNLSISVSIRHLDASIFHRTCWVSCDRPAFCGESVISPLGGYDPPRVRKLPITREDWLNLWACNATNEWVYNLATNARILHLEEIHRKYNDVEDDLEVMLDRVDGLIESLK